MATRTATKGKAPEVITVPNPASYPVFPDWFQPVAEPYSVEFELELTKPYLFNRWNADLVEPPEGEEQSRRRKKGSPPEAMVTLNSDGNLSFPSAQILMACVTAGKNYRNPRAKAGTLGTVLKEGLQTTQELVSFGVPNWDYIDVRRANHAGSWVPKRRPAMEAGHRVTSQLEITLPQYIEPPILNKVLQDAGRLYGIGDGRTAPLFYGRFMVLNFTIL
jgi:hypothetical protein